MADNDLMRVSLQLFIEAVSEPTLSRARRQKLHFLTNFSSVQEIAPNLLLGHKNNDFSVVAFLR
jgi:hypothetical protein